jgi:alpha-galactosidase
MMYLKRKLAIVAMSGALLLPTFCAMAQEDSDILRADKAAANVVYLDTLNLTNIMQDWGAAGAGKSVDGNPLTVGGQVYKHGIGTHAKSELAIDLKGGAKRFVAMVGVDDERKISNGTVTFSVFVDGKKAADSGVLKAGQAPKLLSVNLAGAKKLVLIVGDADDGITNDHADWAGAAIVLNDNAARPVTMGVPLEPARIALVAPSPAPAIHGPRIVGGTPGRPFLFLIPVTGKGPLEFNATGLPAGLTLNKSTGVIAGTIKQAGTYTVKITVKGAAGTTSRKLTVVGGEHKLALTPPMGWNSWNVWAGEVDDAKVRAAADAMISSGLAAHGFQYVNIDDTWEGNRDASGEILTNKKFPDMKATADYVHSKGLKIGIYSSPGPKTCAGFEASYQHEVQDANTYAKWGIDYLKHDWCSYGSIAKDNSLAELQKPYFVMRDALYNSGRDIVYSLCQYGMGDVWKWGAEVGGNCWRTTGDINDSWGSLRGIYKSQAGHEKYAGPGHWNDPDMLVVGAVGWGNPHPSHLTPNEQVLHISMWCLLSSPLLIGCDMSKMDQFTIALLSNDEALDINQDPLGKPAGLTSEKEGLEVWSRKLYDGTYAVGLVNSTVQAAKISADWSAIGIKGSQPVRDLWLHKNVGNFTGSYSVEVPAHGCVLLKIGKSKDQ